ncbi:hypothetical protein C8046_11410 [Serinibacter arcticus]|uniref:Uncharacterized protein n=1 Tax=Serinibacter arcticus TaxID=1655435 RepID=A0A2U1ZW50_9MICO|nr:hypothetical protein C8046_11410 [Serinibacter arcticus]
MSAGLLLATAGCSSATSEPEASAPAPQPITPEEFNGESSRLGDALFEHLGESADFGVSASPNMDSFDVEIYGDALEASEVPALSEELSDLMGREVSITIMPGSSLYP